MQAIEDVFGKSDTYVLMVPRGNASRERDLSDALKTLPEVSGVLSYEDNPVAQDQLLFQRLLRDSELLRSRYRYTKHMLEGIFQEDRDMYRAVKEFFIMGVLAGYRQALAEKEVKQHERMAGRLY